MGFNRAFARGFTRAFVRGFTSTFARALSRAFTSEAPLVSIRKKTKMCMCVYVCGKGPSQSERLCKAPMSHIYTHTQISVFLLLTLGCPQDILGINKKNMTFVFVYK